MHNLIRLEIHTRAGVLEALGLGWMDYDISPGLGLPLIVREKALGLLFLMQCNKMRHTKLKIILVLRDISRKVF